jgi:hypothetical protein
VSCAPAFGRAEQPRGRPAAAAGLWWALGSAGRDFLSILEAQGSLQLYVAVPVQRTKVALFWRLYDTILDSSTIGMASPNYEPIRPSWGGGGFWGASAKFKIDYRRLKVMRRLTSRTSREPREPEKWNLVWLYIFLLLHRLFIFNFFITYRDHSLYYPSSSSHTSSTIIIIVAHRIY